MYRLSMVLVLLVSSGPLISQDKKPTTEPHLLSATGAVDKADKDTLTIKPRGSDGKFKKAITLKVTGTSKVSILTPQKRADKVVLTQRDAEAKDLVPGQSIAVIYSEPGAKEEPVLLTAVATSAPSK